MVRSLAVLALLLALSRPASAQQPTGEVFMQGDGVNPIVTWCTSSLQTNCLSFFNWFFRYDNVNWYGWGHVDYRAEVELVTTFNRSNFRLEVPNFTAAGMEYNLIFGGGAGRTTSGRYRAVNGELTTGPVLRTTRLDDPIVLDFAGARCLTGGELSYPIERCVSVPEPSSLLLLASGIFGLAYVRSRRAA